MGAVPRPLRSGFPSSLIAVPHCSHPPRPPVRIRPSPAKKPLILAISITLCLQFDVAICTSNLTLPTPQPPRAGASISLPAQLPAGLSMRMAWPDVAQTPSGVVDTAAVHAAGDDLIMGPAGGQIGWLLCAPGCEGGLQDPGLITSPSGLGLALGGFNTYSIFSAHYGRCDQFQAFSEGSSDARGARPPSARSPPNRRSQAGLVSPICSISGSTIPA